MGTIGYIATGIILHIYYVLPLHVNVFLFGRIRPCCDVLCAYDRIRFQQPREKLQMFTVMGWFYSSQ